jgi:5-methylcytosine-specific restriction endonuclease McrA
MRRVENCELSLRGWFANSRRAKLYLRVGRTQHLLGTFDRQRIEESTKAQWVKPVRVAEIDGRTYWQFHDRFYWDSNGLTADEAYALLATQLQSERRRIEHAQETVAAGMPSRSNARGAIPDDVKQLVWIRDEGRCRACGRQDELQYDHIIPIAFGGASSPENLQILCGPCNRRKGASLTTS